MNTESTFTEKVNNWMKHSVMLKLGSIAALILLLLIPSSMITSIISERENLSNDAISEVSSKWANSQLINGPVLTIPLVYETQQKEETVEITRYLHILPETLRIAGNVEPQQLKRGIYEIVVYSSELDLSGGFQLGQKIDQNGLKSIHWKDAFLTVGLSDLRGIKENILVNWNGQSLKAEPGSRITALIPSGVTFYLPDLEKSKGVLPFDFHLSFQGSEKLSFVPLGSTTEVSIKSPWSSPSFNGNFLPTDRDVSEAGFSANWKVLQLNRNFPQSWIGDNYQTSIWNSSFGMDLILPLDDYQKSMRSAKYAIMTIALTFLIFFLVEILNGRRIHAFQYTLVGLSLCLFYILLISISEHSNFNLAYGLSTFSIVSMISLYSLSVFKAPKITALLFVVLFGIYGFVFVTLQLADYALLLGSVGLTLILAATMYFTRHVNWYQLGDSSKVTAAK